MIRYAIHVKTVNIKESIVKEINNCGEKCSVEDLAKVRYFDIVFFEVSKETIVEDVKKVLHEQSIAIIIGPEETEIMQKYFDLQIVGYIRNTKYQEDLLEIFLKLVPLMQNKFQVYPVRTNLGISRIRINSLKYIESYRNYITIHAKSGNYVEYKSISKFLRDINKECTQFVQVHKSYIINITMIKSIKSNVVILNDESKIPIGRTYKDDFLKRYEIEAFVE